ncbi:MAG: helix-turn-helix protein [Neobacillus sp.]|nr:helix-turn-helix protein [Neobacillus sp.]
MKDEFIVKKITPYSRLRKWKGWAQIDVAEEVGICRKSLGDYENGYRDPPKRVATALDKLYGCNGELIKYWLSTKFSLVLKGKKNATLTAIKIAFRKISTYLDYNTYLLKNK